MREEEMKERGRKSKMRVNEKGGEDIISQIPESLMHVILSLLTTKDSVRTSVLSKHWKGQWKFTSNINLDQKTMSSGEIQKYVPSVRPPRQSPFAISESWIESVIDQHNGPLKSCRIQHMMESVAKAQNWVRKLLLEKNVKELSMKCDPPLPSTFLFKTFFQSLTSTLSGNRVSDLFVPFEILVGFESVEFKNYHLYTTSPPLNGDYPQKLKTIKLTLILMPLILSTFLSECVSLESIVLNKCSLIQGSNEHKFKINNPRIKVLDMTMGSIRYIEICSVNLEVLLLDTVFCDDPRSVVVVAPNLKVLHCYCTHKSKGLRLYSSGFIYICRILEGLLGSVIFEGKTYPTVYQNLESLYVQLNLRNERESMLLANVLKPCNSLINLEIKNEDMAEFDDEEHDREKWRTGSFKCIIETLKRVSIRGFKGKVLELDFVKCLITMSEKMENITIWFDDDCKLEDVTETMCLLYFPKSSANLSITLKPGKQYLASVGGSFYKWISTLKH